MPDALRDRLQAALGSTYTLERELSGGMSRVFVAVEASLARRVVVKVLPPARTNAVNVARIRRGNQVGAQLQHPHIGPNLSATDAFAQLQAARLTPRQDPCQFSESVPVSQVVGQFPHLFPASIAIGYGVNGLSGARQTTGVWAILGVLAVYFTGVRILGRTAAAAAATLLALNVIQVWFAKYPNSEVVMQALLFAALLANARAHVDGERFFVLGRRHDAELFRQVPARDHRDHTVELERSRGIDT